MCTPHLPTQYLVTPFAMFQEIEDFLFKIKACVEYRFSSKISVTYLQAKAAKGRFKYN
jgi:hypothetical protein